MRAPAPAASQPAPVAEDGIAHLLIVDDDRRLRDLLRRFLSRGGYRVSTAIDAGEARAKLSGIAFDLIVLDVMMPGESGLELAGWLRQRSDVPILLLTALGDADDRVRGLERGADDYLAKPFEPRELELRIESILRRTRGPAPAADSMVRFGDCVFAPAKGELLREGVPVRLSPAELGLLRILAAKPGQTVARQALSRGDDGENARTVDVQITRLRRKIEPDPKTPRYLKTVWGQGYAFWPD